MGEVAGAAVALDLQAWLIDGYYVSRGKVRENPKRGGRNMATRYKRSPTTYFGSPLADTVASGASQSFLAKKRNKSVQNRPLQNVSFPVKQIGLICEESRRDGP